MDSGQKPMHPKSPAKTYTYDNSPSKSKDGSYLIQESDTIITIADPRNKAVITLFKIAESQDLIRANQRKTRNSNRALKGQPPENKPTPITIAHIANKHVQKKLRQLLQRAIALPYTNLIQNWFKNPKKTLIDRELKYWSTEYNKATNIGRVPDEYANKQFKTRYQFAYNAKTLNEKNRKLNAFEKASIIRHTFAEEVDKYIEKYGIYTKHALEKLPENYQNTFYIPGVIITNPRRDPYPHPVAFGYIIDNATDKFFHRYASTDITEPRIVDTLMNVANKEFKLKD